jgi:hypothetical protein
VVASGVRRMFGIVVKERWHASLSAAPDLDSPV